MFIINPLMGVLIGIVVTLVFMAIMIIMIMRLRNKKTNRGKT